MIPFGTPGGDVQVQAMLQVFLNRLIFHMTPQEAVEAPRFATYSFPDSFEPHTYFPNRLHAEARIGSEVLNGLADRGHEVVPWPDWTWRAGAVCLIDATPSKGLMLAGADPRRPSYAAGW
jgi:gamma-glutamyltranspeptidase/glutathione hydrolase